MDLSRTEIIYGKEAIKRLKKARIAVFGLGGVGGYVVEALTRTGVGSIDLIDHDVVTESNINRQIIATVDHIGERKVDVAKARVLSINPDCHVHTYPIFYLPETADSFDLSIYDYVIDAVDTVTAKMCLIEHAKACHTPIICSMGAGNKIDPTAFEVSDIYRTSVCPLAKVIRHECRKRGIRSLKVVYSKEKPRKSINTTTT